MLPRSVLIAVLGGSALMIGGCGESFPSVGAGQTRASAPPSAIPAAQQTTSAASVTGAATGGSHSATHPKSGSHARRGAAKAGSSRAGGATTGHSGRPAQGGGPPLAPKGPNPCVFVSGVEAQAIIGTPIAQVTEAPLGPTCVFRLQGQRQTITIAVEQEHLAAQARYMHKRRRLLVGGHRAFCGILGRSMLDVGLGRGHLLNITAPCGVAVALAEKALRHIAI